MQDFPKSHAFFTPAILNDGREGYITARMYCVVKKAWLYDIRLYQDGAIVKYQQLDVDFMLNQRAAVA